MVLFLGSFPTNENIKDGMVQRIQSIDSFFLDDERVYLSASFRRFFKMKVVSKGHVTIAECNALIHFLFILKLFRSSTSVYIHSVFNVLPNILPILFFYSKKYTLDVHGVVPEEFEMNERPFFARIYSLAEKVIFSRATNIICVTNAMRVYYEKKYSSEKKYIVYTILPKNLEGYNIQDMDTEESVNIIYSGNTQKWQNIDLMCSVIKNNLRPHVKYTILTGDIVNMNVFLKKYGLIDKTNIDIRSVMPSELGQFYKKAHYGFILRSDSTVNNVACPTKLVEYLYYGIIPIIISENIGDFKELGFDYVHYRNLKNNLTVRKSIKNKNIVEKLQTINSSVNIKELIQC